MKLMQKGSRQSSTAALTRWADLIPPPFMKGNEICSPRSVTRFSVAEALSLRIALFAASSVANQSQPSIPVRVTYDTNSHLSRSFRRFSASVYAASSFSE